MENSHYSSIKLTKVKSHIATRFRQWATARLKEKYFGERFWILMQRCVALLDM
jgi:hypothetical protein